jgi:Zn-dependent peptidase ImmA (M78 family)
MGLSCPTALRVFLTLSMGVASGFIDMMVYIACWFTSHSMPMRIEINANMLLWAIERAGFDREDFLVKKPLVAQWLSGERLPTAKQLEVFSNWVHVPYGMLFLPEPPYEEMPITFFRSGEQATTGLFDLNVYDTVLMLEKRQAWLRDYLEHNGNSPLPFVGAMETGNSVPAIVDHIRATFALEEHWASACPTWEAALARLVEVIEDAGIIVVFNGVVGSNTHRPVPVNKCRGFVLVDAFAPFIFVNNRDYKAAQIFTLAHEIAHIWLGKSAGFDLENMLPADEATEQLCNAVAAEFLVPQKAFDAVWAETKDIQALAKRFKVSEIVIARRALDTGKWSRSLFFEFYNNYLARLAGLKRPQSGGGDFYLTTKKRVGLAFAAHVKQAVKTGQLLYRDAYKLTGLKGDTFANFITQQL